MEAERLFRREQRRVAAAMAAGLAITAAAVGIAVLVDLADVPMPLATRLRHVLAIDLLVVAWLVAAIADVARRRFNSPQDIAGSGSSDASPTIRHALAFLQNTLEQTVLAIVAHLTLAVMLDRSAALVTTLACLFTIGRLLFWFGYARGAASRALGFALTFYPSIVALVIAAAVLSL